MDKKTAKEFLFRVADIIENRGLPFFLSDGTCLGAYREKDFIEWDKDIDIKMKAEKLIPYLEILLNEFKKEGYDTRLIKTGSIWHGIKLWFKNTQLDLNALYLINGKRWRLGKRRKHNYPAELFENPGQIKFLGRDFHVPIPVEKYLECLYGYDYMIPKKVGDLRNLRLEGTYGQVELEDVPRFKMRSVGER